MTTVPKNGEAKSAGALKRYLPLLVIAGAMALVFAMGWHKALSFKTIGLNYQDLKGFIGENLLLALFLYMALYIVVVALSLPGGLIMTLSGGLLFNWYLGAPAAIVAASIGATIIFLVAKTSFGEQLAAKAGPWMAKLQDGFKENALSYLLFLRLVPAFPFFIVNLAPALLGVPLRTYVIGTVLGIIPATTAFSFAGAGLGSVIEAQNANYAACLAKNPADPGTACLYTIDTSALVTNELIAAFALLGIVALIPVAYKHRAKPWFRRVSLAALIVGFLWVSSEFAMLARDQHERRQRAECLTATLIAEQLECQKRGMR